MRGTLISSILQNWENSQNKQSKWYKQDRAAYISFLNKKSGGELERINNNFRFLNSSTIDREINKLDNAGMFNITKMKPENALD